MESVGIAVLVPGIWKSIFLSRISQQISGLVSLVRTGSHGFKELQRKLGKKVFSFFSLYTHHMETWEGENGNTVSLTK